MSARKWSPDAVLTAPGVRLTAVEAAKIRNRMVERGQPFDGDGKFPADAVFDGGGVWGVAHLGAIQCFEDAGAKWVSVGGTPAGALTAGLIAAGYTAAELGGVFSDLDYMSFLDDRTYPGWDSNPANDLESPREIATLISALYATGNLGRYRTGRVYDWYRGLLRAKGAETFGAVFKDVGGGHFRQLRVICSDLTHGSIRILPDQYLSHTGHVLKPDDALPDDLTAADIAHAVRCSVSIPGFFEPARLPPNDACIVDGGLLSNFPIWLFDDAAAPRWPTFGFLLTETGESEPATIDTIGGLLRRVFRTLMSAPDGQHILGREDRIIKIDVTDLGAGVEPVSATAFNAPPETLEALYRKGYESAKYFLLEVWNWADHVARRTGPPG